MNYGTMVRQRNLHRVDGLRQVYVDGMLPHNEAYRHLVFLLLLRRKRKLRFLISNFKHSTGVFELALPNSSYACGF